MWEGAVLGKIPWDVWVAAFFACMAALAEIFDPGAAIFVMILVILCGYMLIETVSGRFNGS